VKQEVQNNKHVDNHVYVTAEKVSLSKLIRRQQRLVASLLFAAGWRLTLVSSLDRTFLLWNFAKMFKTVESICCCRSRGCIYRFYYDQRSSAWTGQTDGRSPTKDWSDIWARSTMVISDALPPRASDVYH